MTELDPSALEQLADRLRRQQRWPELCDALTRIADLSPDREERAALYREAGTLAHRRCADPNAAVRYFEKALGFDHADLQAIEGLIAIFRPVKRWDLVAKTLALKLVAVGSDEERARTHIELAGVLSRHLDSADEALTHLEMAIRASPDSREAQWTLADLHLELGAWDKALPLLQALSGLYDDDREPDKLAAVYRRVGRCHEELGELDEAAEAYAAASELACSDVELLWKVATLHFDRREYAKAQGYYEQLLEDHGDEITTERFVRLVTDLGECSEALARRREEPGFVAARQSISTTRARGLERVAELFAKRGNTVRALEFRRRALELIASNDERASRYLEQALGLLELGDPAEALADIDRVLELQPANAEAVEARLGLLEELGDWDAMEATCLQRIDALSGNSGNPTPPRDPVERALVVLLCRRLGDLYERHFEDRERAADAYRAALFFDGADDEASAALTRLTRS